MTKTVNSYIIHIIFLLIFVIMLSVYWTSEQNTTLKGVLIVSILYNSILFFINIVILNTQASIKSVLKKCKLLFGLFRFILVILYFSVINYSTSLSPLSIFAIILGTLTVLTILNILKFLLCVKRKHIIATCGICDKVIDAKELETLTCNHQYHKNCISEWKSDNLNVAVACPVCIKNGVNV